METDYRRDGTKLGQNVSFAFHRGDFFLRVSKGWQSRLDRFVRLMFGDPFITPTRPEMGMYVAHATSLKSADLSRQVGVAIYSDSHDLLVTGCNEVPSVFGGMFWEGDNRIDTRDWIHGRDFNAVKKIDIIDELIEYLKTEGIDFSPLKVDSGKKVAEELISGDRSEQFGEIRIAILLEFGRVVHAEMNAICDAAGRGIPIKNGILYSTTFPCHMCARHIVASGIDRVCYIEPYPKSLAIEIYKDEIALEKPTANQIYFEGFEGIAPNLFSKSFTAPVRKIALDLHENGLSLLPSLSSLYFRNRMLSVSWLLQHWRLFHMLLTTTKLENSKHNCFVTRKLSTNTGLINVNLFTES